MELEVVENNETPTETLLREVQQQAEFLLGIVATLRSDVSDYVRLTNILGMREIGAYLIVLARKLEEAQGEVK